jgi:Amino acid permease
LEEHPATVSEQKYFLSGFICCGSFFLFSRSLFTPVKRTMWLTFTPYFPHLPESQLLTCLDRIGFRYWKHPGAMNTYLEPGGLGRFLAILGVLVQAAFSFQGVELVAIAASETKNPRRNLKKAVGRVFYRILIFYILGIFITGLIVPYNDENLLQSTGNAAQSPYVIAMARAGIKGFPHLINACVFTSAFSAGNSFLRYLVYCVTCALWSRPPWPSTKDLHVLHEKRPSPYGGARDQLFPLLRIFNHPLRCEHRIRLVRQVGDPRRLLCMARYQYVLIFPCAPLRFDVYWR